MNRLAVLVVASLIACLAALPAGAQGAKKTQALYAANGSGGGNQSPPLDKVHLLELDRKNGEVRRKIGVIGYAVTGLALHPKTKVLYGVTGGQDQAAPGSLIRINKATGKGKLIGDEIEGEDLGATDITFTNDGTLYGMLEPDDEVGRINLQTGAATLLGSSTSSFGGGLSANSGDTLFLTPQGDDGDLYTVDRADGSVTSVATLDGTLDTAINALAFDRKDKLFGSRILEANQPERDLIRIDTESGHITRVGETVDRLDAIEFSESNKRCKGAKANVLGTSKKDQLRGTKRDDLVAAGRGNDKLNGSGGDDCVSGEEGNDKVSGGGGKDKLKGGGGKDKVKAADGKRDKINCGGGEDRAAVDPEDRVTNCEEVELT
jgi:Ca2+-binding RTX toxin-like protein